MSLIDEQRLARVLTATLTSGQHAANDGGEMCVMEAVAWITREPWSDSPACVSPVIAVFARIFNDTAPEQGGVAIRARLRCMVPRFVGTVATPAVERRRSLLALDWLIRVYLPTWLRLMPSLTAHADELASLPALTTPDTDYVAIGARVSAAWDAAWDAARDAAWDAAWDAARDAASAAARDAASAAARDAARDAANAAARAAAWDAASAAARDAVSAAVSAAARDAVSAAVSAAASAAARAAAWDAASAAARDAASAAAWDALRPTVEALQASAFGLLDAMLACGEGGA